MAGAAAIKFVQRIQIARLQGIENITAERSGDLTAIRAEHNVERGRGKHLRQFEAIDIVGRGSRSGERLNVQSRRTRQFDQQAGLRIIAQDTGKHNRHAEAREVLGDVARDATGLDRDLAGHIRGRQRRARQSRFDIESGSTNGQHRLAFDRYADFRRK